MRDLLPGRTQTDGCRCLPAFDGDGLVVDSDDCDGRGVLATEPGCRAAVVGALADRDAETIHSRSGGVERAYEDDSAALLVAAGRFVERVAIHDRSLATLARRDPIGAAVEATGRAGPVSRIAAETGLAELATRTGEYDEALRPYVAPTVTRSRIATRPPPDARLDEKRTISTDAVVRVYSRPASELRTYHVEPLEHRFEPTTQATLDDAYELLASGGVSGGDRAPGRAVRGVATVETPIGDLVAVLKKHTRGHGILDDLFADDAVSDVYATSPVDENRLRVVVDGETMRTNVRLTVEGARSLASRFRRASGRSFSRASPTIDAVTAAGDRGVRVAGVTDPASDGIAFAFRARDSEAWTLPGLVENGTIPADAAAYLSTAVDRDAAILVAGPRGAGKTTMLGALLWELSAATRIVVIEDTAELPVESLQAAGRDVQPLRTTRSESGGELGPTEALRTALRLGEGALVLGEVRGEEAQVLYEAMRVGASDSAVLGTVHGDGGEDVRDRVVSDLGVASGSFASTDLVVSLERSGSTGDRRAAAIEEVVSTADGTRFESLFDLDGDRLTATGRLDRGNSVHAATSTRPTESYEELLGVVSRRERFLSDLAASGRTGPDMVASAYAERRSERRA